MNLAFALVRPLYSFSISIFSFSFSLLSHLFSSSVFNYAAFIHVNMTPILLDLWIFRTSGNVNSSLSCHSKTTPGKGLGLEIG